MAILERMIQKVVNNQWDAVLAQEKEWEALEAKVGGFPMKRRYRPYASPLSHDALVWEREWENFAACEAAYTRLFALPEVKALAKAQESLTTAGHVELYMVLE
jgi:hypothetical protein